MGRRIKRPDLETVSPPFFDLHVGHSAKVLTPGRDGRSKDVYWVKVLEIRDDALLGSLYRSGDAPEGAVFPPRPREGEGQEGGVKIAGPCLHRLGSSATYIGVVTSCDRSGSPAELGLHDVIEFESRHVFGMF